MIRLLREDEVATAFRAMRRRGGPARLAVAFWGSGAAKRLGIGRGADVEVLCNLDHVGCNPEAVRELMRLGIKVRTHPRLHAKVYATRGCAIVGSSNASSNGLAVEGDEALGWLEANVQCDRPDFAASAWELVGELSSAPEARTVRKADIEEALRRRSALPRAVLVPPRARSLVAACRESPEAFSGVIVYAYDSGLGRNAKRELARFREQAVPDEAGDGRVSVRKAWAYQGDPIPEGTWVVDLDCKGRSGTPTVWGCSRSTGIQLQPEGEDPVTVTLRGSVTFDGVRKYRLAKDDRKLLEAAGQRILKAGRKGFVTLPEAIRIADAVAAGRPKARR